MPLRTELSFISEYNAVLKDFLIHDCGISKRLLAKLKRCENGISVNGVQSRVTVKIKPGDIVGLRSKDSEGFLEGNSELNVPKVFENESLVEYDKPVGMPVHPSIKHQGDTLGNYFSYICSGLTFRPINRLDRDTSGVCVAAKNAFSAKSLQQSLEKTYYAVVCGKLDNDGTIDAPIGRTDGSIIKREVSKSGQNAVTHYKAVKCSYDEKYTLVKINLETGRTHQIRVHFSYIGFPLAGDEMYGGDCSDISRQALHCKTVRFCHPITKEIITIDSELPEDMTSLIK